MKRFFLFILAFAWSSAGARIALAQTPECDRVQNRGAATRILKSEHPYVCCDQTILECLKTEPVCPVVVRLADDICRRVAAGQQPEKIVRDLHGRAQTMLSVEFDKPREFDLAEAPMAGDPQAPVVLVEFFSARGPHCARMTPPVFRAVTEGPLKGKVRLYLKHFPLRRNPHAKEAALAFLAAARRGKLWEFAMHSFKHFEEFSLEKQIEWAESLGLNRKVVESAIRDPGMKKRLVADKREGLEAGVNSTPTFFINGHRYRGELVIGELVDVLEEAYEQNR